jgi:hypothetical protein
VATRQHDIIEKFLVALSARNDFPAEKIEELRVLFAARAATAILSPARRVGESRNS